MSSSSSSSSFNDNVYNSNNDAVISEYLRKNNSKSYLGKLKKTLFIQPLVFKLITT